MTKWKKMSPEEKWFRSVGYLFLILFSIVCLVPFLIILASSFSGEREIIRHGYGLIPRGFTLESYAAIFKNPMEIVRAYGVTLFVTVTGTLISVFLNTMTGYVLQRKDFCWRKDRKAHV